MECSYFVYIVMDKLDILDHQNLVMVRNSSAIRVRFALKGIIYNALVSGKEVKTFFFIIKKKKTEDVIMYKKFEN